MSFFIPSVHIGRSRAVDPDDPTGFRGFGAPRRPKRIRPPIPWTLNIPYMCQILLASLVGLLIMIGGAAMSVMGYYPGYFSEEFAFNGSKYVVVQNPVKYYHIRNFSFAGPILMGVGCFAMIIAGVIYFEFRDKYFRELPQDEIKHMSKKEVYDLLIEQFRQNYFRGIPIPLAEPKFKGEKRKVFTVEKKDKMPAVKQAPCIRKPSSLSVCQSTTVAYVTQFSEVQRKCSLSTLPSVGSNIILSPLDLIPKGVTGNKDTYVHEANEATNSREIRASMFRHPSISLSGRTPSTGVENPAYRSDDDSEVSPIDDALMSQCSIKHRRNTTTIASPSFAEDNLASIIVHAASVHFPPDCDTPISQTAKPKSKSLQHDLESLKRLHSQCLPVQNTSCPLLLPAASKTGLVNPTFVKQNERKQSVPYHNCATETVSTQSEHDDISDQTEKDSVNSQLSKTSSSASLCMSTRSESTSVEEQNCHKTDCPLCEHLGQNHNRQVLFDQEEVIDNLDALT